MLRSGNHNAIQNRLLHALAPADFARLEVHLQRFDCPVGTPLLDSGSPLRRIYFPERAIVSVCERLGEGQEIEIAVVGSEGFLGWPLVLSCPESAHTASVHTRGGSLLGMDAATAVELCHAIPSMWASMLRFVHVVTVQMSRAILSEGRDSTEKRVARWLLMRHDRLIGDEIRVTHDDLALHLGVRRASVTDSLHVLEGKGALRSCRGKIFVRDRATLESAAGEAYGLAEAQYRATLGPFGKPACDGVGRAWVRDGSAVREQAITGYPLMA